jgi:hypothetical protein
LGAGDSNLSVTLGGQIVQCASREDVEAVKAAADILARVDRTPHSQEQITQITSVLKRLGHHRAARTLVQRIVFG